MEVSTKGQKPTTGRIRHSVTVLDNKSLLFMGGYKEYKRLSRTAHILHLGRECLWFGSDRTDDMSWQEIEEIGQLYPVIRSAHKVVKVNEYGHVVAGGIVRDFVEPFYYLDIRLVK